MPQRHSKNAGVMGAESLSYHERRALGFGTAKERLGKDSFGRYYECCLTLQPAVDPVVTPGGYLYSREAILENLLAQKKAMKRKAAAWEEAQRAEAAAQAEQASVAVEARLVAFDRQNNMGVSSSTAQSIAAAIEAAAIEAAAGAGAGAGAGGPAKGGASSVMAIKANEQRAKEMKAFWAPSRVPEAKVVVDKPDMETRCPASNQPLRLRDLVPVKFTPVPEEEASASGSGGEGGAVHMDPITRESFGVASRIVVLAATGDAMLKETYKKCVKPEGRYNGVRIRDKEVIELKTGGTGFVGRDGERVQASKFFQLGPGSGLADLRGQTHGGASRGGLVFNN